MNQEATDHSPSACPACGKKLPSRGEVGLCPVCLLKQGLLTDTGAGPDSKEAGAQPKERPLPDMEKIGRSLPQFEILECLGRGGMGVVYKARQKALDRFVALKILAPERERDAEFAERFVREAKALAQLNHPNIVTVYEFGESRGVYYIAMEFVDGVNLRHLIVERTLSTDEAIAIVPSICEALQYAHDKGLVHCDIKPENLLLNKEGRIKVADFGIAKIMGRENDSLGNTRVFTGQG